MRTGVATAVKVLAIPALVLCAVVVFLPGYVDVAVRIDALAVGALVVLLAIAALRRAYPPASPLRPKRRSPGASPRPPALTRLEKDVALGTAGSFELHYRLSPILRSLARARLAAHRGISLDDEPEAARDVLGDDAWELVRPDRRPPEDRLAAGLPTSTLAEVVDALERT